MTGRDPTAVVAGLLFVVLGVLLLLEAFDVLDLRPSVLIPALFIGLGVAVLAGAARRTKT